MDSLLRRSRGRAKQKKVEQEWNRSQEGTGIQMGGAECGGAPRIRTAAWASFGCAGRSLAAAARVPYPPSQRAWSARRHRHRHRSQPPHRACFALPWTQSLVLRRGRPAGWRARGR